VGAELFRSGGRTDRHDEANSRLSQFCERAQNRAKALSYREFIKWIRGTWVADGVPYIRSSQYHKGLYLGIEEIDYTYL
jgi:hypothetical protein